MSRRLLVQRRQTIMSGQPLHPGNNSNRRSRRRVCPPQGLRALEPCLETPATPQTLFARVSSREKKQCKPEPEQSTDDGDACTTHRRQLLTLLLPAIAIACAIMRDSDGEGGCKISSWYVLVDLSHTATCVWLAGAWGWSRGAGGDAP